MIALFRQEVARACRREVVRFVAAAGIAGVLVGCAIAGVTTHRPSEAEWASARAQREGAYQQCLAPARPESGESQVSTCDPGPVASWLAPNIRVFDLQSIPNTIIWSSLLLALAGWLVGGALVGADWASGTFASLLTWEPRRARLLFGRLSAVALVTFVLSTVLLAALVLGLTLVAFTRGLTFVSPGFWGTLAASSLRVIALSTAAALTAASLAFVSRSATFAVASLFVYLVAVEGPVYLRLPQLSRWLVVPNSYAWTTGRRPWIDAGSLIAFDAAAAGVLALWIALIIGTAFWTFKSRDVV